MRSVVLPLVKKSRLVFTPAPAFTKAPDGKLTMHQRSHSSSSFRLVWAKAVSLVRNSTPSSSTMPQRPPGLRSESTGRQADDAPEVALVEQLPLGLGKGRLVGAEQHAFIQHDAATPTRLAIGKHRTAS